MKKYGVWVGVFFVIALLSLTFVSASFASEVNRVINEATNTISPIASKLLGETPSGEWLFAKVLFLVIIFSVIWTVLDRVEFFSGKTWALALITSAASLLATRWIAGDALINTIILPYSALGVTLSAGLPFILYFFVVEKGLEGAHNRTIRKLAWVFFAVVFIGLWFTRPGLGDGFVAYVYPVTALAAFIMLFADGTIQRFLLRMQLDKLGAATVRDAVDELKRKIHDLKDLVDKEIITPAEADKRKKEYGKKILDLSK